MPDRPDVTKLRQLKTYTYDDQGHEHESVYYIDQSGGGIPSSTYYMATFKWYDSRGNLVKVQEPGGTTTNPVGLVYKYQFDAAERLTQESITDGGAATASPDAAPGTSGTLADALNTTGDIVLSQTQYQFDSDSQPIMVTTRGGPDDKRVDSVED